MRSAITGEQSMPNIVSGGQPSADPYVELERASEELKQKIEEQRRKHDMPVNSSLGNPDVDAQNADGHNDVKDDDDD
jgi:hypothetical protein